LGYEGPSFDKGGYINRGFDDLDWLPAALIEESPDATPLVEIASNVPLSSTRPTAPVASAARDTSNQPGPREAEMAEVKK